MREGLKLIKFPGYYGPVYIGWLRRIGGDQYELVPGCRWITRLSGNRDCLALADDGPLDDHKIHPASKKATPDVNEFRVWQAWNVDEEKWLPHCPKPKDWDR